MKDTRTDLELIERTLEGDMSAFKELVDRYEGKVAAVVKSILGDTTEAVDVGQEVFIRFYRSIASFRADSSLGTYLVRIAINLSLNELKRRKRENRMFQPLDEWKENETRWDDDETVEDILQREVSRLEPEFRSVVVLRIIEGYSSAETASILMIPLGTVLSRLARAQQKLKTAINKTSYERKAN